MTFTDAAREVLSQAARPLHYKEITELAIEKNLLSHVGKSPEVTMGARLAATLKKGGDDNPLVRVKPGVFALSEWDEETIKQGLAIKRTLKKKTAPPPPPPPVVVVVEVQEDAAPQAEPDGDSDDDTPTPRVLNVTEGDAIAATEPASPDEEKRAEIAASGSTLFAEEDDDDQPIMRLQDDDASAEPTEGRRRRRRRRRRGSRSSGTGEIAQQGGSSTLPGYTATPVFEGEDGSRGPQVIELTPGEAPSLDGLAGRDLAEAVAIVLGTFDRTVGAVSLRQITETAQRRSKLSSDTQLAQSHIAAAVRADNARRASAGLRPRFRMAGGRIGLTDWLLDPELARLEREAIAAVGRYRDAARRAFTRKLNELPGHAFVELALLVFERLGVSKIRQVKFPGASGAEAQFSAVLHTPSGVLPGPVATGDALHLALVVRKDGRDIGRERVSELRGTAHHYDSATMGWIITSGQVLSGAREEANATGVTPVSVIDGAALARLCEEHGIATVQSSHPISIPDVDLFEALRAS